MPKLGASMMAGAEQNNIKEYLLGSLTDPEEERLELRLLTDPDFAEDYDTIVDEIVDDYVLGKFTGEELGLVKRNFFKSNARREKLKFALALKKRKAELSRNKPRKRFSGQLRAIAACLLIAAGGLVLWRIQINSADLNQIGRAHV